MAMMIMAPATAAPVAAIDGGSTTPRQAEIRRAADGMFYINANVNGAPVRFLIDTGATAVVLAPADARRVGVVTKSGGACAETASGRVTAGIASLASLAAGPIVNKDVPAFVGGPGMTVSLLGQSWLQQLDALTIEGDRLLLQ